MAYKNIFIKFGDNERLHKLRSISRYYIKKCWKGKTLEFYSFLSNAFHSKGKSQKIYQCGKNMMTSTVIYRYDSLGDLNTKGKNLNFNTIKKNSFALKMFNCGHIYYLSCWTKLNGEKVCYLCEKQMGNIEDLCIGKFGGKINEEEKNKILKKKLRKKKEQERKKHALNRRLEILKNMRIKRREINNNLNETVN